MRLIWLVEVSSRRDWHRRIKMDQRTPLRRIVLRQKFLNRYVYELRVADIAVAICNCGRESSTTPSAVEFAGPTASFRWSQEGTS